MLADLAERLSPHAADIAREWSERLDRATGGLFERFPDARETITDLNRWFFEWHLFYLRGRDLPGLFRTLLEADVALLEQQSQIDPELRSSLSQIYLSLEISTGVIVERLRRVLDGDARLEPALATYARLSLQLAELVGLAFWEVRSNSLRSALRVASSLLDASRDLNSRPASLDGVLSSLTRIVQRLVGGDRSLVFLWNAAAQAYFAAASHGFSAGEFAEVAAISFRRDDFPAMQTIFDGHLASGTRDDGRVPRALLERYGEQVYAVAPIQGGGGQRLGTLAVYRPDPTPFDAGDLEILRGVALNAGLAIENAQLVERLAGRTEELARSNADLEQFAYVASHDLQEPLRMVGSYVQLLARRYDGRLGADASEFIGFAVEGVRRMQGLIEDLLAYSRIGRRGDQIVTTEAGRVLDQALANLESAIAESGAVIERASLPTVRADPMQLLQLFQNLLANSIKFRGAVSPRIAVRCERRGGEWVFAVADNGIGIDPAYASRIFVIFQRLHARSEYPGSGIGLAICKKIVERHGGRIWFESELGKGATFFFSLPAADAAASAG